MEAGAATILHDVRPGPGISRVTWLSDWVPGLEGTPVDTRVFILEGSTKGDTVFVLGGTHENEIAGIMTALLLVEKARVVSGRLIVITNGNNSAATWNERLGEPAWIALNTRSGTRFFKYGSRLTNPVHQMIP
jgi:predicted deacylase